MTEPLSAVEAARRLQAALTVADTLSCAEAEELLPALLEADHAGEDPEQNPGLRALLTHLDHCAACLDLYEQILNAEEAVVGAQERLSDYVPAYIPTFFSQPIPKGEYVLLQVLKGIQRRFELSFALPRLMPSIPTMSGQQRTLYADTLAEVAGSPFLALQLTREPSGPQLQLALRDPGQAQQWRIELQLGEQTLTQITDARGMVRFALPADSALTAIKILCEELLTETEDK